jgi:hypothetical protein
MAIIKKPDGFDLVKDSSGLAIQGGKLSSKSTPFQQRVNKAKTEQVDAATMPNRVCLMLDRSSSMTHTEKGDKKRIDLLKDAVSNFAARCDFSNTSVACETFPASRELALTSNSLVVNTFMFTIEASGNTPMHACVERCIGKVPMTRGVIVSDGEATDWYEDRYDRYHEDGQIDDKPKQDDLLTKYKAAGIPIDCVHIGDSSSGEELLRKIAKETGGIFLKFTDVSAFSNAFGYLAPGFRAMLTDGRVSATELGASEVQR